MQRSRRLQSMHAGRPMQAHLRRDLAVLLMPPLYLSHSTAPAKMPVAMATLVRLLFSRRLKLGISAQRRTTFTRACVHVLHATSMGQVKTRTKQRNIHTPCSTHSAAYRCIQ